jgi:hypothetical protein
MFSLLYFMISSKMGIIITQQYTIISSLGKLEGGIHARLSPHTTDVGTRPDQISSRPIKTKPTVQELPPEAIAPNLQRIQTKTSGFRNDKSTTDDDKQ